VTSGRPVSIRRNIANFRDSYIRTHCPHETVACSKCGSTYHHRRWYLKDEPVKTVRRDVTQAVCPACLKIREKMPGGIVHLSGAFLASHMQEILSLIHNQNLRAMRINPLERIMDIETGATDVDVLTTNEKLAQKIGRALHKAYRGAVSYMWSHDTKLARVNWRRD